MNMSTYDIVRNAFYSGAMDFTGDNQTIRDAAFLVDEKYLNLRVFPLASRKKYLTMLDDVDKHKRSAEAAGGEKAHVALKLLAGAYLQKRTGRDVQYEHPFCGYYPDVMSTDKCIVVECGHTHNAEKMLTYFKQGGIKECVCVPYPDPDEHDVLGYSFTASANLVDFLTFWETEKRLELQRKLGSKNP